MLLIGPLAAWLTTRHQRRTYQVRLAQAREEYRHILEDLEQRLLNLRKQELEVRLETDPDPNECLHRAHRQDPRLGERRPEDDDFLAPRLGLGAVKASIHLTFPGADSRSADFAAELAVAENLYASFASVPAAPVTARLSHTGSIGLAGQRLAIESIAHAMLSQIATHHWPTEVHLAVISPPDRAARWKWMHLLPHAATSIRWRSTPRDKGAEPPPELMTSLEAELQRRQKWIEARTISHQGESSPRPPLPYLVLLVDGLDPSYSHPALAMLLRQGPSLGVLGVFLAAKKQEIPGTCGAVLELSGDQLAYMESGPQGVNMVCSPDGMDPTQAEMIARSLGAIEWPLSDDVSQPPPLVTLLETFGVEALPDLPMESWWDGQSPYGYLRAPVGKTSATAEFIFDLNEKEGAHGPHGLLGGMTGSGKSEVLKAIVLALAITHHPLDLQFALIDYKGGAAFNELARLPHTVGVVTDIESHATYGERVILALSGEIERRKRLLEQARRTFEFGRSHIDEYRRLRVKRPLPRLVVVFDEFAEFKQRHPEESKRLITIARQGRSLGVHLILATQNIQAAIDPQILQNSSFRICLRVSEPQDSLQLIGIPDAVHLSRGRGYFSAQARHQVQFAFPGAPYDREGASRERASEVVKVWPDGTREVLDLASSGGSASATLERGERTEAAAVVDQALAVARKLRLRRPTPVWPDPLPERIYLPELLQRHVRGGWDGERWTPARMWRETENAELLWPVLGLYDQPALQQQDILQPKPETTGGHLLLFGSSGTGKSTLLRTLVTSLAVNNPPDRVHVYILDFGVQAPLKVLELYPHVGAVVTRLETERAERLIQFLHAEVSRRTAQMRQAGVDSWADLNRSATEGGKIPAIFLLIDNFQEFRRMLPVELVQSISSLVAGGQAVGIFTVISGSLQSDLPNDLFANINLRLTFHQSDQTEYFRLVGQPSPGRLEEEAGRGPLPGRGLLRGTPPLEFQAALPSLGETDRDQYENLTRLAERLRTAWSGATPFSIRNLPFLVTMPEMPSPGTAHGLPRVLLLGQDYETLSPLSLSLENDGPTFLLGSVTPHAGKTTMLRSLLVGLAERHSPDEVQFVLLDFHSRTLAPLRRVGHVRAYVGAKTGLAEALEAVLQEVDRRHHLLEQAFEADPDDFQRRSLLKTWPQICVVIDDYEKLFPQIEAERRPLQECLMRGGELGIAFLIAGHVASLPPDFDDSFIMRVRRHGCGVLLGGTDGLEQFNNARRPPGVAASGMPSGRGMMVRQGIVRLFQAAAYWQQGEDPEEALARRVQQIAPQAATPHRAG
jgi:S-DNA-T family DNA segregation ATPase FtsK/SpoIIIE